MFQHISPPIHVVVSDEAFEMRFYPTYGIQAEWGVDVESPAEISRRIAEMTQGLTQLAPAKSHWLFVDGEDSNVVPVAETMANMPNFLARNIRESGGEPDPDDGYLLVLVGSENDSDTVAGNDLHVMAIVGSKWANSLRFQAGDIRRPNDFSLITYPTYKAALEVLASAWACPWAVACAFDSSTRLARQGTTFDSVWIAYLSAPLAREMAAPSEITVEPTPGGGAILSAVPQVIDRSNPDHVQRSRALESIMIERVGLAGLRPGSATLWPARTGPY